MKAVLFAAGLGTRLGSLTQSMPKALVSVQGRPMLYRVMDRFREAGIKDFVINVHAFASMVEDALYRYMQDYPDVKVDISDERDLLLETGGGLKKMAKLLNGEEFVVHNVDILSNLDLDAFVQEARNRPSLATLAVRKTQSDRYFLFDKNMQLCGWENVKTQQRKISREVEETQYYGFMGIHYLRPEFLDLIEEKGVFSVTDVYLRLAKTHRIDAVDCSAYDWMDIGSPQQLALAEAKLINDTKR